jgi:hypothetical protein
MGLREQANSIEPTGVLQAGDALRPGRLTVGKVHSRQGPCFTEIFCPHLIVIFTRERFDMPSAALRLLYLGLRHMFTMQQHWAAGAQRSPS